MKPNIQHLIDLCIENGLELGFNRAHKHTEQPSEDAIKQQIYSAIWQELDHWFVWDNPND